MLCSIEPLEGRRLMSVAMNITFAPVGADMVLTINNATDVKVHQFADGSVQVTSGTQTPVYTGAIDNIGTFLGVGQIVINGTDGQDNIILENLVPKTYVHTFKGSDTISISGSAQTMIASDEDGATIIVDAGGGKDLISITGESVYVASSTGHDFVYADGSLA